MGVENRATFRLLDLCHGPGWGLADVAVMYPAIRITAIDFTDAFAGTARDRVRAVDEKNREMGCGSVKIRWTGPREWGGFGSPLPFGNGAFDAVFFSGGDPYIPRRLRRDVYGEIGRVLAHEGRLGILTRGYPDPGHRYVPSTRMRIATLVHDFAESVCGGWEGFSEPEENIRMFMEIGYREGGAALGGMSFLESSLWVLSKGARLV
jgi:SAM-dependent methyltransferase